MNARNWEVLDLKPMPEDAWYIEVLKESFESPSFSTSFYLASGNWYLDAAELDFDAYFMSRRKKMRSTVRSKTKQLQEQFALDIRIVTGADEVASGIAEYDEVYSKSWKQPEPHLNFIPGLAASLAQQGKLKAWPADPKRQAPPPRSCGSSMGTRLTSTNSLMTLNSPSFPSVLFSP